jgi:hypothetical protein
VKKPAKWSFPSVSISNFILMKKFLQRYALAPTNEVRRQIVEIESNLMSSDQFSRGIDGISPDRSHVRPLCFSLFLPCSCGRANLKNMTIFAGYGLQSNDLKEMAENSREKIVDRFVETM